MQNDIVIVGGGLVGAALALSLKDSGLKIALVEAKPFERPPGWDSRIYAISPGSAAYLESCGAWQKMDFSRVGEVAAMQVYGDDGVSQLEFDAFGANVSELAFIVESGNMLAALNLALEEAENVERLCPQVCRSLCRGVDEVVLELDGREIHSQLLVGADGARSWVRQQAGFEESPRPYGQSGVVANFATQKPHGNVARQWFREDGILAFLPLPGNMISIVWSTWEENAKSLVADEPQIFCERVAAASGHALGELELITAAAAFPLRLLNLGSLVKPRIALIGDAAHNTHPLAGQGVNLGFRDARELSAVLQGRTRMRDCGEYSLLRQYDRARQEDIMAMQLTTDMLQKLFNNSNPLLKPLRNLGLRLVDSRSVIKNFLARQALA